MGVVAILDLAVLFGNFVLFLFTGVACSADSRETDPHVCTDHLTWPLLLLTLPSIAALGGTAVSLKRRSFDAAIIGLMAAPLLAPLAFKIVWSIT